MELGSEDIRITVKESKRAKRVRLTVHPNGSVVVVRPCGVGTRFVNAFVASKKDWILEKIRELPTRISTDLNETSDYHFLKHKVAARLLVEEKLDQWNATYQFSFRRVVVKNMKSRWGSCSSKKTLCFHYKILFLPEELQDYLIVHELCHLAEMNHSGRFWHQVERVIPHAKVLRKQMPYLT